VNTENLPCKKKQGVTEAVTPVIRAADVNICTKQTALHVVGEKAYVDKINCLFFQPLYWSDI
jgi:hypothetical protein